MSTYNENNRCSKCGQVAMTAHGIEPFTGKSVLVRQCIRCAYKWYETPLDAVKESGE